MNWARSWAYSARPSRQCMRLHPAPPRSRWRSRGSCARPARSSAFVPQDCCPAHHQPRKLRRTVTSSTAARAISVRCIRPTASRARCTAARRARNVRCSMRGTCNGPAAALATLFSIPGILVDQSPAPVVDQVSALVGSARASRPVCSFRSTHHLPAPSRRTRTGGRRLSLPSFARVKTPLTREEFLFACRAA